MENFNQLISTGNMNLYIVHVKGKSGYYAEALENGNVCFLPFMTNQINFLKEEKLKTYHSEIPMNELFLQIKNHINEIPAFDAHKDEIKTFFRKVVPEYNEKRVLIKYLRKLIYQFSNWSNYMESKKNTKSLSDKWLKQNAPKMSIEKLKLA